MHMIGRISRQWLLILAVLAFCETPGMAQEQFRLVPEARFLLGMQWSHQWLAGEMLIPAGGRLGSGTKIDVNADLGVDQGEASSVTFGGVILDNHLLDIDLLMFSPTGMKKIPRTFRFHNKTYPAGTSIDTRLDFNWLRVSYGYKAWADSGFWVAPRIGVHYIGYSATLSGETKDAGLLSNTRSLDAIYPVLGLESCYQFPYGMDLGLQLEGIHLVTTGFLAMVRLRALWEVYPDVVISVNWSNRLVQSVEDIQPLNNEWLYMISGVGGGISFGF